LGKFSFYFQGLFLSKKTLFIPFSHIAQTAIPFLIGTKFDQFATFPRDEQEEITKQVRPPFFLSFFFKKKPMASTQVEK